MAEHTEYECTCDPETHGGCEARRRGTPELCNAARATEIERTEGWAFLTPTGIGAHYFRDGRSFCGRPLPEGRRVAGDYAEVGSDPEQCVRCANKAHAELDALSALENDDHFVRFGVGYCGCECGGWSSRTLDQVAFAEHVSDPVNRPGQPTGGEG